MFAPNNDQIIDLQKIILEQGEEETTFEESRLIGVRLFALYDLFNEINSISDQEKSEDSQPS